MAQMRPGSPAAYILVTCVRFQFNTGTQKTPHSADKHPKNTTALNTAERVPALAVMLMRYALFWDITLSLNGINHRTMQIYTSVYRNSMKSEQAKCSSLHRDRNNTYGYACNACAR